jgi:hypothetical protein
MLPDARPTLMTQSVGSQSDDRDSDEQQQPALGVLLLDDRTALGPALLLHKSSTDPASRFGTGGSLVLSRGGFCSAPAAFGHDSGGGIQGRIEMGQAGVDDRRRQLDAGGGSPRGRQPSSSTRARRAGRRAPGHAGWTPGS